MFFESLESRQLLSAAVMTFSDGMKITQSGSGSVTIKAGSGKGNSSSAGMNISVVENNITQTNGGPSIGSGSFLIHDNTTGEEMVMSVKPGKSIKIQGGKGDDTIFFDGASTGADIQSGDGNDNITVLDEGTASSKIDAGNGDDTIAIVYSRNAEIKTGNGDDTVLINTSANPDTGTGGYDYDASNIKVQGQGGSDTAIVYAGKIKADGKVTIV